MDASKPALKIVPRSSLDTRYQEPSFPRRRSPRSCCLWAPLKRLLCCCCAVRRRERSAEPGRSADREEDQVFARPGGAIGESGTAAEEEEEGEKQSRVKQSHAAHGSFEPEVFLNREQLQKKALDRRKSPTEGQTLLNPHGNGGVAAGDARLLWEGSVSETSASDESRPPRDADASEAGEEPRSVWSEASSGSRIRLSSVQVEYDDVTIATESPTGREFDAGLPPPHHPHGATGELQTAAAACGGEAADGAYGCMQTAANLADILQRDDSARNHHDHQRHPNSNTPHNNNNKRMRLLSKDLEAELDRKVSQLLKKHQMDLLQTYSPSNVMEIMSRHFHFSQDVSELSQAGLHEVGAGLAEIRRELCEDRSCPPDEARELLKRSFRRVSSKRSGALSSPTFQLSLEDSGDQALRLGNLVAPGDEQ